MATFKQFLEEHHPGDVTTVWNPNPAEPIEGGVKVHQLIQQFVTNLVPNLVGPKKQEITAEELQNVVAAFQRELQHQIDNYNPTNNLGTDISALFRQGQKDTSRPNHTLR